MKATTSHLCGVATHISIAFGLHLFGHFHGRMFLHDRTTMDGCVWGWTWKECAPRSALEYWKCHGIERRENDSWTPHSSTAGRAKCAAGGSHTSALLPNNSTKAMQQELYLYYYKAPIISTFFTVIVSYPWNAYLYFSPVNNKELLVELSVRPLHPIAPIILARCSNPRPR